jgi:hypothetical protein
MTINYKARKLKTMHPNEVPNAACLSQSHTRAQIPRFLSVWLFEVDSGGGGAFGNKKHAHFYLKAFFKETVWKRQD